MNKEVKAVLNAVKEFLSGHSGETNVPEPDDKESRKAIAGELVATMAGEKQPDLDAETEIPTSPNEEKPELESELDKKQERSRQLFMQHGYFDEAVQELRVGKDAADRAAAARALGLVGSQRATPHLIAAMFDDDAEVRSAAGEALNQIGDPNIPNTPRLETLVSQTAEQTEPTTEAQTAEAPTTETPTSEAPLVDADSISDENASSFSPDATQGINVEVVSEPGATDAEFHAQAVDLKYEGADTPNVNLNELQDNGTSAEEKLILEEHAIRETIEDYQRQMIEAEALRLKAENEARWRVERETKIRLDAEARRVEDEEQRKRAEEESVRRLGAEQEALSSERAARLQVEAEAHRLAQEEARLRLESSKLRQTAEDLSRQRRENETNRRAAAEAARLAEATRARLEAEKRHQDEVARLSSEEQSLNFAVEETIKRRHELAASRQTAESEVASLTHQRNQLLTDAEAQIKELQAEREKLISEESSRRAEAERLLKEADERKRAEEQQLRQQMDELSNVTRDISAKRLEIEAARERAQRDAEQLAEALTRMRAAEEDRLRAEQERMQVETTTRERVEAEQRLLDEARKRAVEEQARIEEEKRRHDEAEERRMAAIASLHEQTQMEVQQRAEKEQQLRSEIDHMRIADAEVRRRMEEAETLRRNSEQAYRSAAEKIQRIEAEAHAAAQAEEQILVKLEGVRRNVAAETQARAEQEKRVKEEIEQLRRLHDEERPRLEAALLQRTAAASRLQQMQDSQADVVSQSEVPSQTAVVGTDEPGISSPDSNFSETAPLRLVSDQDSRHAESVDHDVPDIEGPAGAKPALDSYLNSVDPYKRAAAVAELARSRGAEAFPLIAGAFDDPSSHVRNAAARALSQLSPARTIDFFNRTLEEGSEQRRQNVGRAIADSRLANEAIDQLASESREDTYNALSILFVMAKTGEMQPLVHAIETHPNDEVAQAVIKLLTLSGQAQKADEAMKKRRGEA